jgi:hypothetical protein
MDEYFECRTGQSVEETLDEQTTLNGEATARSAIVPAYIEDLAERQFHNFRELMGRPPAHRFLVFFPPSPCTLSRITPPSNMSL